MRASTTHSEYRARIVLYSVRSKTRANSQYRVEQSSLGYQHSPSLVQAHGAACACFVRPPPAACTRHGVYHILRIRSISTPYRWLPISCPR